MQEPTFVGAVAIEPEDGFDLDVGAGSEFDPGSRATDELELPVMATRVASGPQIPVAFWVRRTDDLHCPEIIAMRSQFVEFYDSVLRHDVLTFSVVRGGLGRSNAAKNARPTDGCCHPDPAAAAAVEVSVSHHSLPGARLPAAGPMSFRSPWIFLLPMADHCISLLLTKNKKEQN
jgi:hypothetical protein